MLKKQANVVAIWICSQLIVDLSPNILTTSW